MKKSYGIIGLAFALSLVVLFGTTKNAVFNQLFAALITYVLLKCLYTKTQKTGYHLFRCNGIC
ncbi:hypothetical protein [Halalkalibacterium ligniniphilum]|uniref:hypothetical protein n=1 Tax=Halalkalibacterium ligniniphilum TaxID=1134413 RepID=UPI000346139F